MSEVRLDPRDVALRQSCPVVPVPLYSELEPHDNGQRVLLARDGVFLDFINPWLACRVRVSEFEPGLRLPYGSVTEEMDFAFGAIPLTVIAQFIEHARAGLPNEVAGGVIYDTRNGDLTLRMHRALSSGAGHIRYRIDELASHELLAIDLHSHGLLPAFWSRTDDDDDRSGVKVCGVFGNLDRKQPSGKFRLVVNGVMRGLPSPWDAESATLNRRRSD